jgi:glyoxylase-like metal-dependent hydrolase (beta-lactamase superfamily II)
MTDFTLTRRAALAGAATLPFVATATRASAPMLGAAGAQFQRVPLGSFEVTTILAGSAVREEPHKIFGLNVDADTFESVSSAANISTTAARFFFTPTLVNTGAELILFDTGLQGPMTVAAIEAAGYTADQVDVVVITHMHGDHIGGLMTDGAATFPNARYVTGSAEFDHWAKAENERFEGMVRPLAEQFEMLDDGASVASGVTAMDTSGHTPGHMAYMIESDGKQLAICADFANHYIWSLAHPDWEVRFDMDKAKAAATRRRVLDMLATDKVPFIGYHMPFPAIGYVEKAGDGFTYAPHSYQLTL